MAKSQNLSCIWLKITKKKFPFLIIGFSFCSFQIQHWTEPLQSLLVSWCLYGGFEQPFFPAVWRLPHVWTSGCWRSVERGRPQTGNGNLLWRCKPHRFFLNHTFSLEVCFLRTACALIMMRFTCVSLGCGAWNWRLAGIYLLRFFPPTR